MEKGGQKRSQTRSATYQLAVAVSTKKVPGYYDPTRQTWSDREYADAASKKHNEAM